MTDRDKKLLVVLAGVAVFGSIVTVRSGLVALDFFRERQEQREAACEANVERTLEAPSPLPGYRAREAYRRTTAPPSATRLATLRLPGRVSDHERIAQSDHLQYVCLYRAAVELGGNAYVMEGIEVDPAHPEQGKLVEGVYLVAAPPLPAALAGRYPRRVGVVTDVSPGSPAERAGLLPGDLVVDLDHQGLGDPGDGEGTAADEAVHALKDGVDATLTVLRDGRELDLPVRKEGGMFGFRYTTAPILPAAGPVER